MQVRKLEYILLSDIIKEFELNAEMIYGCLDDISFGTTSQSTFTSCYFLEKCIYSYYEDTAYFDDLFGKVIKYLKENSDIMIHVEG